VICELPDIPATRMSNVLALPKPQVLSQPGVQRGSLGGATGFSDIDDERAAQEVQFQLFEGYVGVSALEEATDAGANEPRIVAIGVDYQIDTDLLRNWGLVVPKARY